MELDHEALIGMLTRLKLTAIRDQLDNLLHEASRRELTLREAVGFLCEREIARKAERRIELEITLAHYPTVREPDGFHLPAPPSLANSQTHSHAACRRLTDGPARLP